MNFAKRAALRLALVVLPAFAGWFAFGVVELVKQQDFEPALILAGFCLMAAVEANWVWTVHLAVRRARKNAENAP